MAIQSIISFIAQQDRISRIPDLILNILRLQEKLSDPGRHSEYFRWGFPSHSKNLTALLKEYEAIRSEYNERNVKELLCALTLSMRDLETISTLTPLIIRSMVKSVTVRRIDRLKEYLELKSMIDKLPGIYELISDPDMIISLLE